MRQREARVRATIVVGQHPALTLAAAVASSCEGGAREHDGLSCHTHDVLRGKGIVRCSDDGVQRALKGHGHGPLAHTMYLSVVGAKISEHVWSCPSWCAPCLIPALIKCVDRELTSWCLILRKFDHLQIRE